MKGGRHSLVSCVFDHQSDIVVFRKLDASNNIFGSGDGDRVTDIITKLASAICGSVRIA